LHSSLPQVFQHGLCKEHFDSWTKSRKGAKQVAVEAPAA